jgi:hypothetical protein
MTSDPCFLCGSRSDVAVSLVEWRDPIVQPAPKAPIRWEDLPRCRDRVACRDRVEKAGQPSLVVDPVRR